MLLRKRLVMSLASVLVTVVTALAVPSTSVANGLIIYSTTTDQHTGRTPSQQVIAVRILDSLVGQVRHDYTVVPDTDIGQAKHSGAQPPGKDWVGIGGGWWRPTLAQYQYVIYFGAGQKQLSPTLVDTINDYRGPLYAFNYNANQFTTRLPWLRMRGSVLVNKLEPPGGQGQDPSTALSATDGAGGPPTPIGHSVPEPVVFNDVRGGGAHVSLTGQTADGGGSVPLALHTGRDYYFAGGNLQPPVDGYVTESLLAFFGEKGTGFVKYLRLEDVHPLADARLLMEQARWLKQEGIPYMVAVIPVYQYGNGKTVHLDQSPSVVKALQYMQANGGSMLMHGYTHKFRAEETGEGFEFWDAENDRPIYQPEDEKPKFRSDFATEEEWNAFVKAGEQFERSYTEDRIRRAVQEMVANGLYPLAFEPPHYAISQQGYQVVARHFSSFVGMMQMSDSTWNSGYGPPYESRPTFLHGMTVYPETLGFIEQDNEQASFVMMRERIESRAQFSLGYLSAFYHPYLGLEGLKKVVAIMNKVSGTWLDLKERHNLVQVENIRISTEDGKIHVDQPSFPRFASAYARNLWLRNNGIWILLAILGLLTAAGFLAVGREIRQKTS